MVKPEKISDVVNYTYNFLTILHWTLDEKKSIFRANYKCFVFEIEHYNSNYRGLCFKKENPSEYITEYRPYFSDVERELIAYVDSKKEKCSVEEKFYELPLDNPVQQLKRSNPNQKRSDMSDFRKNTCDACAYKLHNFLCRVHKHGEFDPSDPACPSFVPKEEPPAIKY